MLDTFQSMAADAEFEHCSTYLVAGFNGDSFLIRGSLTDDLYGCSLGLLRIVLMRERPRRTLLKPFLSFPLFPSDCAVESSAGELMLPP